MNILFVVDAIFPDAVGGVHTYIYELARGLVKKGHVVSILTQRITGHAPHFEIMDGINICRYNVKKYRIAPLTQFARIVSVYREFVKLNAEHRFDLINLHSPHASFGVGLSKAAKNIPKVYTFHALLHREELLNIQGTRYGWLQWRRYVNLFWSPFFLCLLKHLEREALKKSERIIVLSDFTTGCLIEAHRVSPDKIVKIPAGVDTDKFKPANEKSSVRGILGLPAREKILFTVRRLVPRMGLTNLIAAMPIVLKRCPDTKLIIGGDGPMRSNLQILINRLGLMKKIALTGLIDDERLPLYYQAADLFILPSMDLEGFGIVTLEALASGLPVLGTPVGGTIEILSRLNRRLLFRDTSPDSMARLIVEYLTDDKKRTEMSNKCRPFIEANYSWGDSVQLTESLFSELTEKGDRAHG